MGNGNGITGVSVFMAVSFSTRNLSLRHEAFNFTQNAFDLSSEKESY